MAARAFPIPHCYEETTRKEMKRLEKIGVLKRANDSEWAVPTFVVPKKTGAMMGPRSWPIA